MVLKNKLKYFISPLSRSTIKFFMIWVGIVLMPINIWSQTTYIFSGSGDWTNAGNWSPSYPGLTIALGDEVQILSGSICNLPLSSAIINNGSIDVHGRIDISGTIINNNILTFLTSSVINISGGTVTNNLFLTNEGVISTGGGSGNIVNNTGAEFFNNGGSLTMAHNSASCTNSGVIENNATINISNLTNNGTIDNFGNMGMGLVNNPNASFANYGIVNFGYHSITNHVNAYIFNDASATWTMTGNPFNNMGGLQNNGVFNHNAISGLAGFTNSGAIYNYGTYNNGPDQGMTISGVGSLIIDGGNFNNNSSLVNNSSISAINFGAFTNNGVYSGNGSFFNDSDVFTCGPGILAPGNSPGCTSFISGYTNSSGTQQIEVGGTIPCTQHDQVQVSGGATTLSGTLTITRWNNYLPTTIENYTILTSVDLITGTFSTINYPSICGVTWSIAYNTNDVVVTATVASQPEANVKGGSPLISIADGDNTPDVSDHTDFGNVNVGNSLVRTFTVENTGTANLNVTSITSSNPLFTLSALNPASPIGAGMSATFMVTFTPTANGMQTSTITINNNDCNEAVYNFDVRGSGVEKYKFTGATNSDWATATNWNGGVAPTTALLISGDVVTIDANCNMNSINIVFPMGSSLVINSGKTLNVTSSAITLQSGASCTVNGSMSQGVIDNNGTLDVFGSYTAFYYYNKNGATLNIKSGGSYSCPACAESMNSGSTINNDGTMHVGTPSTWQSTVNNNATGIITDGGNGAQIILGASSTMNNYGSFVSRTAKTSGVFYNHSTGTLSMPPTCLFTINNGGSFSNTGNIMLANSSNAIFLNAGATLTNNVNGIITNNGAVSVNAAAIFTNNGTYKGSGTFSSSLFTNQATGIVSPGASPGCQTYSNGFTTNGTTNIEANGTVACTGHDKITVVGTATLNGTLNFTVGYTPANGNIITFISASTLSGTFTTVNAPMGWFINYNLPSIGMVSMSYGAAIFPGAALDFDGINDEVAVASAPLTSVNATIEAWVKPVLRTDGSVFTEFPNNVVSTDIPGAYGRGFGVNVVSGSSGMMVEYKNGFRSISYSFTPDQWYHVAVVYTASNIKTYVNAVLVDDLNVSNSGSTGLLQIGKHNTDGSYGTRRFFKGSIDEVRIWNRALCLSEIQAYKNCEISGASSGLLLNYHFNQGVAGSNNSMETTLIDDSGNNTNGTLLSFAYNGATSNWVAPGGVTSGSSCLPYMPGIINVMGNAMPIANGDITPSTSDFTDFNGGFSRKFKIQNTGSGNLIINSIISSNPAFVINNAPTTIAAGVTDSFTLVFNPAVEGTTTATITINNSDCNALLFNYNVTATATAAKALHFDGADDHVIANTFSSFFGTTPTTIEFWAKVNPGEGGNFIMDLGFTYQVSFAGTLGLSGFFLGGYNSGASVLADGNWAHYAITYDGINTFRAYKNGLPAPTPSCSNCFTSYPAVNNAQLRVGLANNNYFFKGTIDEVRIWREERTAAEILASYNTEVANMPPCLDIYLKFNHGFIGANNSAMTSATDISNAVAANGSLTNFTLNGATSNWVAGSGISAVTSTYIPAPEIDVKGGGPLVSITDGDNTPSTADDTNFGSTNSAPITKTFTITNSGTANVNITGVTIDGTNASEFSVMTQPVSAVGPGGQASFVIKFTPSTVGLRTAVMHLHNDDCDESDYNITIQATSTCLTPSITSCPMNTMVNTDANVCTSEVSYVVEASGNPNPTYNYAFTGATISSGSGTGTGSTFNKGVTNVVVTATNACGAPTCSFTVTVSDNQDPTISCPGNIMVNNDQGFCAAMVNYPTPVGTDNCPNSITTLIGGLASGASFPVGTTTNTYRVTDEAGRMATCSFNVTVQASDFDLLGNGVEINIGDITPNEADSTAFGITLPNTAIIRNFTITNNGTYALTISSITSDDAEFAIGTLGSNVLGIGQSTTFPITFNSGLSGLKEAIITLNSNSCGEESFTFAVNASVGCPHPEYMFIGADQNNPTDPSLPANWQYGCVPPMNDPTVNITIMQGEVFNNTGTIFGDVINYGVFKGTGAVRGNFTNHGSVKPGN